MTPSPDPRFLPHVLVITGSDGDDGKEWEIEHPDGCPRVCFWWRGAAAVYAAKADGRLSFFVDDRDGHPNCYVNYEVENAGLDSLDLGADAPDDGTYHPVSKWAMDRWRQLPPGRYVIEGWYHPARGYFDDAEGGLALIGPEPA
jgi:hypothetical protein